jgi:hypothetical protein
MKLPIPDFLAHLQVDPRRHLPVPVVSLHDTGHDFTAVNGRRVRELAADRACGICGKPLGYWLTFLGGPSSYASRAYIDPPMHPECAEFSLTACPHLAIGRARRATGNHLMTDATQPDGFVLDKPDTWVMATTRSYVTGLTAAQGGGWVTTFHAAPFKRAEAFTYDQDGRLQPAALPTH